MALTLMTGLSAGVAGTSPPGTAGTLALAVVTIAKARLILARYLRLRVAPGFLAGFTAAVFAVMAIVTLTFVVSFKLPPRPGPAASPVPSWSSTSTAV